MLELRASILLFAFQFLGFGLDAFLPEPGRFFVEASVEVKLEEPFLVAGKFGETPREGLCGFGAPGGVGC